MRSFAALISKVSSACLLSHFSVMRTQTLAKWTKFAKLTRAKINSHAKQNWWESHVLIDCVLPRPQKTRIFWRILNAIYLRLCGRLKISMKALEISWLPRKLPFACAANHWLGAFQLIYKTWSLEVELVLMTSIDFFKLRASWLTQMEFPESLFSETTHWIAPCICC
jgi:hypothetical protein